MGRRVKKEITMAAPKFAVRYFWNRKQYVLAKNNEKNRYSFWPIDEIYNRPEYSITQFSQKDVAKTVRTFEKRLDELIGYEAEIETVNTMFLVQDGYIK